MSNNSPEMTTTLPSYSVETFIDRETQIELVTTKVESLAKNKSKEECTIVFKGQRGTGKSWLMLHLYALTCAINGVSSILIDLKDYAGSTPDKIVRSIISVLAKELIADPLPQNTDLPELSREFIRQLRFSLNHQPLTLFIDTVFESDWNLLAVLENYILGPMAMESAVLIIIAGRGHPYPWKTPELRLRAKFTDLEPFDDSQTEQQLTKQKLTGQTDLKRVYELSQGNPLANYILAIQTSELSVRLNQTINELLNVVPVEEKQSIREYLEAICVLNTFDEEQIPAMFVAYYNDNSYDNWKSSEARKIREKIVRRSFAHWDETQKGYVLDSTLLNLLRHYLKETKKELWKDLNCAAYHLYIDWAKKYERTANRWQVEANYHQSQLAELDFSIDDCSFLRN